MAVIELILDEDYSPKLVEVLEKPKKPSSSVTTKSNTKPKPKPSAKPAAVKGASK